MDNSVGAVPQHTFMNTLWQSYEVALSVTQFSFWFHSTGAVAYSVQFIFCVEGRVERYHRDIIDVDATSGDIKPYMAVIHGISAGHTTVLLSTRYVKPSPESEVVGLRWF